jgi:hypothetical protein
MGDGTIDEVRGAQNVARLAMAASHLGLVVRPALVNGTPGWVASRGEQVFSVGALTVQDGRSPSTFSSIPLALPASTSPPSTPSVEGARKVEWP